MPEEPIPIPNTMQSDPVVGLELGTITRLSSRERRSLLAKVRAGDVTEYEFEAIVFRAVYPNSNFLRFNDDDLPRLAESFVGQPFLRNHATHDIGSRDGTITASRMHGKDIVQTITLTTERGMLDFLQGRMDRFSIGWYYDAVTCSVCGHDFMECTHWPGRRYETEDGSRLQCEAIFTNPTGKECSAVNVPAVRGTRVLSLDGNELHLSEEMASLCERKLQHITANGAVETPGILEVAIEEPEEDDEPQDTPAASEAPNEPAPAAEEPQAPQWTTNVHLHFDFSNVPSTPEDVPQDLETSHPEPSTQSNLSVPASLETTQMETEVTSTEVQAIEAPASPAVNPAPAPAAPAPAPAAQASDGSEWLLALKESTITGMLHTSGLSDASQKVVRVALGDVASATPERVRQLIEAQREVEARLIDLNVVHSMKPANNPAFGPMLNDMDQFKEAFEALLDGRRPANGIRPLSGIREAYIHLSGDYDMTGKFYGDRVQLSNVNTATMAGLMAEYLNMRVVRSFQTYDQFWRQYCQVENFSSLHDPHWLILGGIGELSDVAEGSTYTEKDWSVQTETSGWVKKGNWLGITMEAFDKDQTGYLQQAPRALAQAAYLSLGKSFTRMLITANGAGYGPTIRDSKALFHADHANLGNTALSQAAWEATRLAMARQTEQGSNEVLGNLCIPTSIMIPRHLENTALVMLASEGVLGSGNNDINPSALDGASSDARRQAARRMICVNDFLGTANSWFAFANPTNYPLIGLGFRYGETPQIYSVADERVGLMFTNDVMPIKIRFFFSMGPIDFRGMYMHKVA